MMIVSCDGPQHDVSFLPIQFLQDLMPSCCSLPDRLSDVCCLYYDDAEDDAAVGQDDVALINHFVAESYLLLKEKTDQCCFVVEKKKKSSVMRMTNWCVKMHIVFWRRLK